MEANMKKRQDIETALEAPVTLPRVVLCAMVARSMVMGAERPELLIHDNAYRAASIMVNRAIENGTITLGKS